MLIGQVLHANLHIVFVVQTIFEHIKLQHPHNAHNNLFHTGIVFLKNLNGALLSNLGNPFHELLPFHGVHLTHTGKMFRCKSRNSGKCKMLFPADKGVTDGENTGIKHTDNISGIRLVNNLSLLCHQLLRLRQFDGLIALYMKDFHTRIKFTGADAHKCNTIPMCFIHVRLNLKDKGRKIR